MVKKTHMGVFGNANDHLPRWVLFWAGVEMEATGTFSALHQGIRDPSPTTKFRSEFKGSLIISLDHILL